jgi:hypothetical protein
MSQYHNNNLIHNLRVGATMVKEGMDPDVASLALAKEGIDAPSELLAAAAKPGVLESMSSKPYTHVRAKQQIAANKSMKENLSKLQSEMQQDVFDDEMH